MSHSYSIADWGLNPGDMGLNYGFTLNHSTLQTIGLMSTRKLSKDSIKHLKAASS